MIKTKRDMWVAVALVTMLTNMVVLPGSMLLMDREEWASELPYSLLMATVLSVGVTLLFSRQLLRNHELADQLTRLLHRDRLTDVATRDCFYREMEQMPDATGILLMIDIDHFKSVNDTHGHCVGDAALQEVASAVRRNCRRRDIVCRFGGEEFLVFLVGASRENGLEISERLRLQVENQAILHENLSLRVTVSIGLAAVEGRGSIDAVIRTADEALYRAKDSGRNRSVPSWPLPSADARRAA